MARDERTSDLAGKRAIALATEDQKKVVKKQVAQIEKAVATGGAGTGAGAAGGAGAAPGGTAGGAGG
jgi:hypothetical protein